MAIVAGSTGDGETGLACKGERGLACVQAGRKRKATRAKREGNCMGKRVIGKIGGAAQQRPTEREPTTMTKATDGYHHRN
jgi:hypothetical protein